MQLRSYDHDKITNEIAISVKNNMEFRTKLSLILKI